jgi:hypothetical protein
MRGIRKAENTRIRREEPNIRHYLFFWGLSESSRNDQLRLLTVMSMCSFGLKGPLHVIASVSTSTKGGNLDPRIERPGVSEGVELRAREELHKLGERNGQDLGNIRADPNAWIPFIVVLNGKYWRKTGSIPNAKELVEESTAELRLS